MTQNLNVNRLKTTAWDQKAVQGRGHINVVIPDKIIDESRKKGGSTTKEPMKDLTHSICEAVFEEFEPVVRDMPVWKNIVTIQVVPTILTFLTTAPGAPVTPVPIPGTPGVGNHSLGRIPKGYIVISKSAPVIIYDSFLPPWSPSTITIEAQSIGLIPVPIPVPVTVKILVF